MKTKNLFIQMKANRRSTLFLLFCMVFILPGCEEKPETDCLNSTIEVTSLEKEYGCTNTKYSLQTNLSNDYRIILNQADFDQLVTGNCKPKIDFSKYTLIIGEKSVPNTNFRIDYSLETNCDTQTMILEVKFIQTLAADGGYNLTYHVLIPKMTNKMQLNVKTEIIK